MLIVDTGVILAAADHADPDHVACVEVVERTDLLVTTHLVIAEAAYLIARQLGPAAEAAFFRSVAQGDVAIEALTSVDLERVAELVETYVDLPLGGTDAGVIAIAERLGQTRIGTLDRRHFAVVRPAHCPAFELVP
ncbi:MAG: type II toxin-antitoxin system VapC family toxin [Acidimicrobiia bacterium]